MGFDGICKFVGECFGVWLVFLVRKSRGINKFQYPCFSYPCFRISYRRVMAWRKAPKLAMVWSGLGSDFGIFGESKKAIMGTSLFGFQDFGWWFVGI